VNGRARYDLAASRRLRQGSNFGGSGAPSAGGGRRTSTLRLAALAVVVTAALLGLSASPASAARSRILSTSFGSSGSGAGQLSLVTTAAEVPSAVAVNEATGDVYVTDTENRRIDQFEADGTFVRAWGWGVRDGSAEAQTCTTLSGCQAGISGLELGQFESPKTIAVDNAPGGEGAVYVAEFDAAFQTSADRVQKFTSEGALIDSWAEGGQLRGAPFNPEMGTSGFGQIGGLAVDPSGNLWVATGGAIFAFTRLGTLVQATAGGDGFSPPLGIATDGSGDLYINGRSVISEHDASGANLGNSFQPAVFASGIGVDTVGENAGEFYVDEGETIATIAPGCAPSGSPPFCPAASHFGSPQLSDSGGGLAVDSQTDTVYAADTGADEILGFIIEQPSVPLAGEEAVTNVTSDSAHLEATLNPRSEEGEEPTVFFFEYGPCDTVQTCATSPFGFETEPGQLDPDFSPHPISADIAGLKPGTPYHFRVSASNQQGPSAGEEARFTTQTSGPFSLPDSRQWQLVSPAKKLGARILPIFEIGIVQAAASGKAIAYRAQSPSEAEPQGFSNEEQILSRRATSGWSSRDIGTPLTAPTGLANGSGPEEKFFDPELTRGVVQPFGQFNPGLSSEASESTAFLHDLSPFCGPSCFRPLVTGKQGFANVPPGTAFGEAQGCAPPATAEVVCGPTFQGATDDLSHVVLLSITPLTAGATGAGLYEWNDGALSLVSVGPNGQPLSMVGTNVGLGFASKSTRRAISSDGSRIVFSAEPNLYMRFDPPAPQSGSGACDEADRACTIQLDVAEEGCLLAGECESGGGIFQIASADGSRVFFTDFHRLTANSGAFVGGNEGSSKADLYECHILEDLSGGRSCGLTDLTPANGSQQAEVLGGVLGASADGSTLYFVANGVLASNTVDNGAGPEQAEPGNCDGTRGAAIDQHCNLYVSRGGEIEFIASLTGADSHDWTKGVLGSQPTRVSPNGEWLAFMAQRSPTGYDNRDVATGEPVAEVYLYDAASGRILCPSCEPSGARPRGVQYDAISIGHGGLTGASGIWGTALVAATVPGWTRIDISASRYQDRYLSDSGRLFFNALGGLVAQDSNGNFDVYQYEPHGVGGCTESNPTFSHTSAGCVGLISAGTSGEESAFLDASENGDDVFFLTGSQLVPQDTDAALDVYDAHVCSAEVSCLPEPAPPAPACEGDACQPPAVPPNDPTPGSLTANGAGNVLECPKGKVKRSAKCVKKHKAKKKQHTKKGRSHRRTVDKTRRAHR
jgi:hypothetical protein